MPLAIHEEGEDPELTAIAAKTQLLKTQTPSIHVLEEDSGSRELWARRCRLFRHKAALFQLSSSPAVRLPPPYLFTMKAVKCPTIGMLPPIVHWSPALYPTASAPRHATDCFDPEEHQSLDFLYSSWVEGTHTPCVEPQVMTLHFYGRNDLTLGYYVEHLCLDTHHHCSRRDCDQPVERHIRSFAHGDARVLIGTERLKDPIPNPNFGEPPRVFMWSWCKECNAVTPVIPMSEETWHVSLAKYLELTFFAPDYRVGGQLCPHSYHHRHVRYFGKDNLTMYFEYQPINLLEVTLSPRVIAVPLMGSFPSQWFRQMHVLRRQLSSINEEVQRCLQEAEALLHVVAPTSALLAAPGAALGATMIHECGQHVTDDLKVLHGLLTEMDDTLRTALARVTQRSPQLGARADACPSPALPAHLVASPDAEAQAQSLSPVETRSRTPTAGTHTPTGENDASDQAGESGSGFEPPPTVEQPLLPYTTTRELERAAFRLRQKMGVTVRVWNASLAEVYSVVYAQKKVKKASATGPAAGTAVEGSTAAAAAGGGGSTAAGGSLVSVDRRESSAGVGSTGSTTPVAVVPHVSAPFLTPPQPLNLGTDSDAMRTPVPGRLSLDATACSGNASGNTTGHTTHSHGQRSPHAAGRMASPLSRQLAAAAAATIPREAGCAAVVAPPATADSNASSEGVTRSTSANSLAPLDDLPERELSPEPVVRLRGRGMRSSMKTASRVGPSDERGVSS